MTYLAVLLAVLLGEPVRYLSPKGELCLIADTTATRVIEEDMEGIRVAQRWELVERNDRLWFATNRLARIGSLRAAEVILLAVSRASAASPPLLAGVLTQWCGNWHGKIPTEPLVTVLSDSLRSPNLMVRYASLDALDIICPSCTRVFRRALEDEHVWIAERAAAILGAHRRLDAVEPLVQSMKHGHWGRDRFDCVVWSDRPAPCEMNAAAEALVKFGAPAVRPLAQALADTSWGPRCMAAVALGKIGARSAVLPLLAALVDKDEPVRRSAQEALDAIDPKWREAPETVKVLPEWHATLASADPITRTAAARALGYARAGTARSDLRTALGDSDSETRIAAAWALGEIRDFDAVGSLAAMLASADSRECAAAARALSSIHQRWEVARSVQDFVPLMVDRLSSGCGCTDTLVRVLSGVGRPAIPSLSSALLAREGSGGAGAVARALAGIGTPDATEALARALVHRDVRVQREAAKAMKACCPTWASLPEAQDLLTHFLTALHDSSVFVRQSAARALGALGNRRALPQLVEATEDDQYWVREAAVEALGKLSDSRTTKRLVSLLRGRRFAPRIGTYPGPLVHFIARTEPASTVRREAARALGRIGDPRALEPLIDSLRDGHEDGQVVATAARALGELGHTEATPALVRALKDARLGVRVAAASALVSVGDSRAVPSLSETLRAADPGLRAIAARALGNIGGSPAVASLRDALDDGDGNVRKAAVEALGRTGGITAVPSLISRLRDGSMEVREKARDALLVLTGEDHGASPEAWESAWKARPHKELPVVRP